MGALSLLVALTLATTPADHSPKEVTAYVQTLSPGIAPARAQHLGALIYRAAATAAIDPMVLTAIVRQESAFQPDQKVCYIVARHHACFATCDMGLAQINRVWVEKWGLDEEALVNDEAYNLRIATRVLNVIRRQFGTEPQWWSRYNTSGPHRAEYEALVMDFLALADPGGPQSSASEAFDAAQRPRSLPYLRLQRFLLRPPADLDGGRHRQRLPAAD